MKFLDEYRDPAAARTIVDAITRTATRRWVVMEVCGGQTHTIVRHGLDQLLGDALEIVHGPGCPVCVTSLEMLDRAHAIAARPGVIFCTFGDMLRVPGSNGDLFTRRAEGADVRIVYSPLDALQLARQNPDREVVFFAVGFETTAPANAMAVAQAKRLGVTNFSVVVSHVLVPPALEAVLGDADNRVQGFLGPGHVCTIMGASEYLPIAARYRVPIVICGFEPLDLLDGLLHLVQQLEAGTHTVENVYARAVRSDGNAAAQQLISDVFEIKDRKWRGIGTLPHSGLGLRESYQDFCAEKRFSLPLIDTPESTRCRSGDVLRGRLRPVDCAEFGRGCTPDSPLGATMVSAEGACAAYYHYRPADHPPA